ncbi:MAG: pantoate--beta-alanine ligase [Gammaproteobacteria bacterium]|nr:pantoate--beta-alanine ligase [Gammaproteobacteria bacterium]MCW8839538.1 pantoate--beta-alanine ligase [Gammaproteobacteria bacterium]MCW8928432.1 pantoate--beta-alanine ligase [Gammaproteobacteria bacterium]MCW8959770.1 pantoate--beta-alanine ligase [Gammaproteobacteria bacterium]MCW8972939.1 pantoate--beta-alanine ligase [Gammaproteobacteria bacterium]
MQVLHTIERVREQVRAWNKAGESVAFVPTMGNLHAGHLALVARARECADRVVVSIFVNPLQFGKGEDLEAYPRTPAEDQQKLVAAATDLLFMPEEQEIYPHGRDGVTFVEVPGISDLLCGASRPGHFRGVATVVCKLLNIVQPDVACFGQKDFQQLAVLRRMVNELNMPLEVVGGPTVREADGLAMSSRNRYLTAAERERAPAIYQILQTLEQWLRQGQRDFSALEQEGRAMLQRAGLQPDYLVVRRTDDLLPPMGGESSLVLLAAAYLGRARLIDNVLIEL